MVKDVSIDLNLNSNQRHASQSSNQQQQRCFNNNNKQQQTTIMPQTLSQQISTFTTTGEKNSLLTAFETINQERLNPSRVEAIQHMFEGSQGRLNLICSKKILQIR